jgi:hypothetical protein
VGARSRAKRRGCCLSARARRSASTCGR